MALLEEKLAALSDGTEAVACVLANWDDVLRAISMASSMPPHPPVSLVLFVDLQSPIAPEIDREANMDRSW